jgi:DNA-binding beta-propeller fold protein YncE
MELKRIAGTALCYLAGASASMRVGASTLASVAGARLGALGPALPRALAGAFPSAALDARRSGTDHSRGDAHGPRRGRERRRPMARLVLLAMLLGFAAAPAAWAQPPTLIDWWYCPRVMGMDIDAAGRLHVARLAPEHVCVYGPSGEELDCWGENGPEAWSVTGPSDVALDHAGHVYVAEGWGIRSDVTQSGLQKFRVDGTYVANFGSAGRGAGQLGGPFGVAIGPDGNVYVCDVENHRVHVFSPEGDKRREWPASGMGIATDPAGRVYLADERAHVVRVYTGTGEPLREWGGQGSGPGQFHAPHAIDLDRFGNVYVADTYNHRIQVFDNDGAYLTEWGGFGHDLGQFYRPMGLRVDDLGNVFVADTWNGRIQKFGPAPTPVGRTSWARVKSLYR